MAQISAKEVMKLRQKTGLSMMECKKALEQTEGDLDAAENFLRKQLKGKMDTRTDRAAGEGQVAIAVSDDNRAAAMVEVRAETDFTAKNEKFRAACDKIAQLALAAPSGDVEPTDAMKALIDDIRISTGENCNIARLKKIGSDEEDAAVGSYVHHDGKTGVVVLATGSIPIETLREICLHITAAVPTPLGVTRDDIPKDAVEKERAFRTEQALDSGKPKEIAEKIVEGGMRKFYEEVALLEQPYVRDPNQKIKDLVGSKGAIVAFYRWQVGQTAD